MDGLPSLTASTGALANRRIPGVMFRRQRAAPEKKAKAKS